MEDGIERMMTPELYNIHYIYEKKKKIEELSNVKELKETISITKTGNEFNLKDIKEHIIKEDKLTNPQ